MESTRNYKYIKQRPPGQEFGCFSIGENGEYNNVDRSGDYDKNLECYGDEQNHQNHPSLAVPTVPTFGVKGVGIRSDVMQWDDGCPSELSGEKGDRKGRAITTKVQNNAYRRRQDIINKKKDSYNPDPYRVGHDNAMTWSRAPDWEKAYDDLRFYIRRERDAIDMYVANLTKLGLFDCKVPMFNGEPLIKGPHIQMMFNDSYRQRLMLRRDLQTQGIHFYNDIIQQISLVKSDLCDSCNGCFGAPAKPELAGETWMDFIMPHPFSQTFLRGNWGDYDFWNIPDSEEDDRSFINRASSHWLELFKRAKNANDVKCCFRGQSPEYFYNQFNTYRKLIHELYHEASYFGVPFSNFVSIMYSNFIRHIDPSIQDSTIDSQRKKLFFRNLKTDSGELNFAPYMISTDDDIDEVMPPLGYYVVAPIHKDWKQLLPPVSGQKHRYATDVFNTAGILSDPSHSQYGKLDLYIKLMTQIALYGPNDKFGGYELKCCGLLNTADRGPVPWRWNDYLNDVYGKTKIDDFKNAFCDDDSTVEHKYIDPKICDDSTGLGVVDEDEDYAKPYDYNPSKPGVNCVTIDTSGMGPDDDYCGKVKCELNRDMHCTDEGHKNRADTCCIRTLDDILSDTFGNSMNPNGKSPYFQDY
jgi:hypothetical protein